jgi:hypothetical protein
MKPVSVRILYSAIAMIGAVIPATAGAQAAPRQYTLFEGANISVNLANSLYPVRDVDGADWVVDMGGKDTVVSGKNAPVNLKIVPMLKLTEQAAMIAGFKREASYTFANDPSVKLTRGISQAANVNAGYQAAADQASAVNPTMINTGSAGGGKTSSGNNDPLAQDTAGDIAQNALAGADASIALAAKQDTEGGHDAMDIEFEISSPKPLQDPYLVTMTRFHPPGTEPGVVQSLVFAKALAPIGASPSKIHFTEEGFPINYEVTDFQLHLYNHGIEVATNVSSKREEMSPDQAFDYVRKAYLDAHRSDTMHAVPVMGELPSDLRAHLAEGKYAEPFYVRVSKDGLANEAFSDAACSKRIDDPYLDSVVQTIRFKPALDNGKPVEGVALVNLSELRV